MSRSDSIRRASAPVTVMLVAIAMLAGCATDAAPSTTPSATSSASPGPSATPSASPEFLDLESQRVVVAPGSPGPSYVATVVNPNAELSIFATVELTSLDDTGAVIQANPLPGAVFPPGETVMVFDSTMWGLDPAITNPGIAFKYVDRGRGHELFTGNPYAGDARLEVVDSRMGQNSIGEPRIEIEIVSTLDVAARTAVDVVIRGADGAVIYAARAADFAYVPAGNRSITEGLSLAGFPGVPEGGSMELWPRVEGSDDTQTYPVQSPLVIEPIDGFGGGAEPWPDIYWATALVTNPGTEPSIDTVVFRYFDDSGTFLGQGTARGIIQPGETRRMSSVEFVRVGATRVEAVATADGTPIGTNGGNLLLEDFTASGQALRATVVSTLPGDSRYILHGICWAADGTALSIAQTLPEPIGAGERRADEGIDLPEIPVGSDHCTLEVTADQWEERDYDWLFGR